MSYEGDAIRVWQGSGKSPRKLEGLVLGQGRRGAKRGSATPKPQHFNQKVKMLPAVSGSRWPRESGYNLKSGKVNCSLLAGQNLMG